jgi:GNAT superfamily N-acetyltransferase
MVHDLAAYERAPEKCHLTEEQLHSALFAERPALFGHVAEIAGDGGPRLGGFALWFLNFSTWHGTHGIYLEDLYVDPTLRGSGLGTQLLTELARICVQRGYRRLEWSVLDWNAPALGFYRSLGAVTMDDWTVNRLSGEALERLGATTLGTDPSYPARTAPAPVPPAAPERDTVIDGSAAAMSEMRGQR